MAKRGEEVPCALAMRLDGLLETAGSHETIPVRVSLLRELRKAFAHPTPEGEDARRDGVSLIAAERKRQVSAEGWTPEHDDTHTRGEMVITAACYAANGTDAEVTVGGEDAFPWGSCHDKRKKHDRVRQLAIAGALIAAEIDRLQRASTPTRSERDGE